MARFYEQYSEYDPMPRWRKPEEAPIDIPVDTEEFGIEEAKALLNQMQDILTGSDTKTAPVPDTTASPKKKTKKKSTTTPKSRLTKPLTVSMPEDKSTPAPLPVNETLVASKRTNDWVKDLKQIIKEKDFLQRRYLIRTYELRYPDRKFDSMTKRELLKGFASDGEVKRFQTGGRVPGYGGGDRVPALLEGGEFVIRKEIARKFLPELQGLNAGNFALDGVGKNRYRSGIDFLKGGDYVDGTRNDRGDNGQVLQLSDHNHRGHYRQPTWIRWQGIPIDRNVSSQLDSYLLQPKEKNQGRKNGVGVDQRDIKRTSMGPYRPYQRSMPRDGRDKSTLYLRHQEILQQGREMIYASIGQLVNDVPDKNLADLLHEKLANDRFPELSNLLVDPYIEIARAYRTPVDMFHKMKTIVASKATMGASVKEAIAGVKWDLDTDTNILHLHEDHAGSLEILADTGIHELGHILSNYKRHLYQIGFDNDQRVMHGVPQSRHRGMNEGFAEYMRIKFSDNRFPTLQDDPEYDSPRLFSLDSILKHVGEGSLNSLLITSDPLMAYQVVPSILHHSEQKGKYNDLIQSYNRYVRARDVDPRDRESMESSRKAIDTMFLEQLNKSFVSNARGYQKGGIIPKDITLAEIGKNRYYAGLDFLKGGEDYAISNNLYETKWTDRDRSTFDGRRQTADDRRKKERFDQQIAINGLITSLLSTMGGGDTGRMFGVERNVDGRTDRDFEKNFRGSRIHYRRRGQVGEGRITKDSYQAMFDKEKNYANSSKLGGGYGHQIEEVYGRIIDGLGPGRTRELFRRTGEYRPGAIYGVQNADLYRRVGGAIDGESGEVTRIRRFDYVPFFDGGGQVPQNRVRYSPLRNYTIVDTEGFSKKNFKDTFPDHPLYRNKTFFDELFQVAAIKVVDGKIVDRFGKFVQPGDQLKPDEYEKLLGKVRPEEEFGETFKTNKLFAKGTSLKPYTLIKELLDFFGDDVLVGHSLLDIRGARGHVEPGIDLHQLNKLAKQHFHKDILNPVQDTFKISRQIDRDGNIFTYGRKLPELLKALAVRGVLSPKDISDIRKLKHHNAVDDVQMNKILFEKEQELAQRKGIQIHTYQPELDEQSQLIYKNYGGHIRRDDIRGSNDGGNYTGFFDRKFGVEGIGPGKQGAMLCNDYHALRTNETSDYEKGFEYVLKRVDSIYDRFGRAGDINGYPDGRRAGQHFLGKAEAIPRYQQGGQLPGYGGGDRRLILAEDGEFIVRKEVAKKYLPELHGLNTGSPIRRYQSGGRVQPQYATTGKMVDAMVAQYQGDANLTLNQKLQPILDYFTKTLNEAGEEVQEFAKTIGSSQETMEVNANAVDVIDTIIKHISSGGVEIKDRNQEQDLVKQVRNLLMDDLSLRQADAYSKDESFDAGAELKKIV